MSHEGLKKDCPPFENIPPHVDWITQGSYTTRVPLTVLYGYHKGLGLKASGSMYPNSIYFRNPEPRTLTKEDLSKATPRFSRNPTAHTLKP